jgi:Rieske Fe-S protein
MTDPRESSCPEAGACERRSCAVSAGDLTTIGRRSFIVQSALFAAAAALAACGASGDMTAPSLPLTGNTIDVNANPALSSVGGVALVSIGSVPLAVVRTGTTSFVALSRTCPHQGGTIQRSGSGFQCPEHGATFAQNGTWTGGQRTSSMHAYATSYDAATGILTVS